MTKDELKQRVVDAIEAQAERIIGIGETVWKNPELGFKEWKTAKLVQETFRELGLRHEGEQAITGFVGEMDGRGPGARVAVLGEMDSLYIPAAPHADPVTGAAHSCGHNAMVATMLGVALGLKGAGAMNELPGQVVFMAVPAEEYVEIEYRNRLRQEGKLQFLGGKQEFIRLGLFDEIDAAMMIHLNPNDPKKKMRVGGTSNGFIAKLIRFVGKEAHAGGAPHAGINALNAAMLGLMGIHAQRETFREADHIRVHPIITRGGDLVNIVPADVRLETYVRGKTIEAIMDASKKVNRALQAGAMAVGAQVEITELPGYLPQKPEETLVDLYARNAARVVGEDAVARSTDHGTGSSDIGDVMHLLPAIHPYIHAVEGTFHSEHFVITDKKLAYVEPAKAMAMTVIDLLWDGGAVAKQVNRDFQAAYDRQSYLKMWEDLFRGNGCAAV